MQTLKHNGHTIQLYDSIDEMPIKRFHQFNRMMLIEAGVGSDLASFDRNLGSLIRYIKKEDQENAVRVIENIRQNVSFVFNGISLEMAAFVNLIHSIDGRELTDQDTSNEGAQAVLDMLNGEGMTVGLIRKITGQIKKNWRRSLRYFSQLLRIASR